MADNLNPLDALEDTGLIEYTDEGLPVKTDSSRHLREIEVVTMLLAHVVEDIKISNRELARRTGLDPRSVGKYRSSEQFVTMLIEYTNKKMLNVRCLAVQELEKLLADEDLNPQVKIKAIHEALSHSERMVELMILAKKDVPVINIDTLLKEIENF